MLKYALLLASAVAAVFLAYRTVDHPRPEGAGIVHPRAEFADGTYMDPFPDGPDMVVALGAAAAGAAGAGLWYRGRRR